MQENIVLTVFAVAPFLMAVILLLFFRRYRQHKATTHRVPRLIAGNSFVLLFLCSIIVVAGEVKFRFFHDTTDSFGLTKTTQEWFVRHFQPNNVGFRDSVDYSVGIPPGKRRITCLGDSFTAGHGVRDVEDRFGNCIRQLRHGWDVQVTAQCGWDTGHELAFLEDSGGFGYQLDVVVLVYCLNDVADIVPEWAATLERIYSSSEPGFLVAHSYFFNAMYYRWKASRDPDIVDYCRFVKQHYEGPVWSEQQERLKCLHNEVKSRGGRLIVVTFPFMHALGKEYSYREAHKRLSEFWDSLGVPELDLLTVYQSHDSQTLVVNSRDAHPNEQAHALAAKAMVTFLDIHLTDREASTAE